MSTENGPDRVNRNELQALARRLKTAVQGAGGNERVAERSGVALRTLNTYLSAGADPKVTKLNRLAAACGTTLDFLLGQETAFIPTESSTLQTEVRDLVYIPQLSVRASAGRGRAPDDLDEGRFPVTRQWLHSIGVSSPGNVEMLWAEGDSMEDTIKHGDMLLLDRGIDGLVNGCIYVFVVAGLIVVKRLQILFDGSLVLSSDKPKYKPETISADRKHELTIEGRVRWYGRSI